MVTTGAMPEVLSFLTPRLGASATRLIPWRPYAPAAVRGRTGDRGVRTAGNTWDPGRQAGTRISRRRRARKYAPVRLLVQVYVLGRRDAARASNSHHGLVRYIE